MYEHLRKGCIGKMVSERGLEGSRVLTVSHAEGPR